MAKDPNEDTSNLSGLSAEDAAQLKKLIDASGGFYAAKDGKVVDVSNTPEFKALFKSSSADVRAKLSGLKKAAKSKVSKEVKADKEDPERKRRLGSSKTETTRNVAASQVKKLGTAQERADVISARQARVEKFPTTEKIADVKEALSLKQRGQAKVTDPDTGVTTVVPDPKGVPQLEGTGAIPRIQGGTSQLGTPQPGRDRATTTPAPQIPRANADEMGRVGFRGRKPTAAEYVAHILYMQGWGKEGASDDLAPNEMYEAPRASDDETAADVSEQVEIPTTPFTESSSLVEKGEQGAITFGEGGKDIVKGSARSAADTEQRALSELGAIPAPDQGSNPLAEAASLEQGALHTGQTSAALSGQFKDTVDAARLAAAANLLISPELNRMRLREGEVARGVAEPVFRGNFTVRRTPSEFKLVKTPVMDPTTGKQKRDANGKLVWQKTRGGIPETQPMKVSGKESLRPSTATVRGPFAVEPDETSSTLTPYEEQIAESYTRSVGEAGSKEFAEADKMLDTVTGGYTASLEPSEFGNYTPVTNLSPQLYPWVDRSQQPAVRTIPGSSESKSVDELSTTKPNAETPSEKEAYFSKLQEGIEKQDEARGSRYGVRRDSEGNIIDVGLDTDVVGMELRKGGLIKEVVGSEQVVVDPTTGKPKRSGPRRVHIRRSPESLRRQNIVLQELATDSTINQMRVPSYYVQPQPAGVYRDDTPIDPETGNVRTPKGVAEKLKFGSGERVISNVETSDPRWTDYDYSTKMVEKEGTDASGKPTTIPTAEEGVVRRIIPTARGLKPEGPTVEEDTAAKIEQVIPGFKEKGIPGVISPQLVTNVFANVQKDILRRKAGGETGPVRRRSEEEQRNYLQSIGEKPMYTDEEFGKIQEFRERERSADDEALKSAVEALSQRKPLVEQALKDLATIKDVKSKAEEEVAKQIREGSHPSAIRKDGSTNPTFMPIEPLSPTASPEEKKLHKARTSAQNRVIRAAGREAVNAHINSVSESSGFKTDVRGDVKVDESGTPIQLDDTSDSLVNPEDETEIRVRVMKALHQKISPSVAGTESKRTVPRKFYYRIQKDKRGNAVLDEDGNPVVMESEKRSFPVQKTDDQGKPVRDTRGNVTQDVDETGAPITERSTVKLTPFVTTAEQLGKGKGKTPGISVKSELDIKSEGGVWHPTENPKGSYIVKDATPLTVARTKSERLREKGGATSAGDLELGDEGLIHSVLDSLRVPAGEGTTAPFLRPVPAGVSVQTLNDLNYKVTAPETARDMPTVEEATGAAPSPTRPGALGSQFDIRTTEATPRDPAASFTIPETTEEKVALAKKLKVNLSIATPNMLRTSRGVTRQSVGASTGDILGDKPRPADTRVSAMTDVGTPEEVDEGTSPLQAVAQIQSGALGVGDMQKEFSIRDVRARNASDRAAQHERNKADALRRVPQQPISNPYVEAFKAKLGPTPIKINVPPSREARNQADALRAERTNLLRDREGSLNPSSIDERTAQLEKEISELHAGTTISRPLSDLPMAINQVRSGQGTRSVDTRAPLMPTTDMPVNRPYLEGDAVPSSRLVNAGQYARIAPRTGNFTRGSGKQYYGEVTYTGEGPRYSEIAGPEGRGKRANTLTTMSESAPYIEGVDRDTNTIGGRELLPIQSAQKAPAFPGQAPPARGAAQTPGPDFTPDPIQNRSLSPQFKNTNKQP